MYQNKKGSSHDDDELYTRSWLEKKDKEMEIKEDIGLFRYLFSVPIMTSILVVLWWGTIWLIKSMIFWIRGF